MSRQDIEFPNWPDQIAQFLKHTGSESFAAELVNWLMSFVAADRMTTAVAWVTWSRKGYPPQILYQVKIDTARQKLLESYRSHYYLLDPAYIACLESNLSGCFEFSELAPDEFHQTEYYREHYQTDAGLEDEIDYIFRLCDDSAINVCLGLKRGDGRFDEAGIQILKSLTPIVEQLVFAHWDPTQLHKLEYSSEDGSFHATLMDAYEQFGKSCLTPREQEVVWLMLRGHSLRSAAEKMGVSSSTVKEHRKNIYVKLDISNHAELFVLFFESLKYSDGESDDPLENYLAQ